MKKIVLGILLIFTQFVMAQMVELSKLSTGKLYDSDVIKDEKNNIKG